MYSVAVYEGALQYGGAEEGGWWFWAGERIVGPIQTLTIKGAWRVAKRLRRVYPPGRDRHSVLPRDPDFIVEVRDLSDGPTPEWWPPDGRPHYE